MFSLKVVPLFGTFNIEGIKVTEHARTMYGKRASALGLLADEISMLLTLAFSVPEDPQSSSRQRHLDIRRILHGATQYRVYNGWRFVIVEGHILVTAERIKPHENYEADRKEVFCGESARAA